ncbi:MAG: hypothetical protein U9Q63_01220, partial [Patescibacteria group bacterium]|nr:hypothetical protein [Patescibacteria group bacterium]
MLNIQTLSVRETRDSLSKLIELTDLIGRRFMITKFGKPRAAIVPVPQSWLKKTKSISDYVGFMSSGGESGVKFENRIRRNKNERDYIK